MSAKTKPQNAKSQNAKQQPTRPASAPAPKGFLKGKLFLVLLCLGIAGATWAGLEFVVWNNVPRNLVGKWVVVGGPQDGATFDFHRSGKMVGRVNMRGKEAIISARVRVEGDQIQSTTVNPMTGKDETRTLHIRVLTDTNLIIDEPDGKSMSLRRASAD